MNFYMLFTKVANMFVFFKMFSSAKLLQFVATKHTACGHIHGLQCGWHRSQWVTWSACI